jgi:ribosome-interacting GTPase 1
MPINAHPDYLAAEKEYLRAQTPEEKIEKLKKMISHAPGHKGAENLRAQLKTRLKKLQQQLEKSKKSGKAKKTGIKKEEMQAVIVGKTNSGKSSLLKNLTNAEPMISKIKFTTIHPIVGMMNYRNVQIQIIENPAIESAYYDKGLTNSADTLLILVTNLEQIKEIENKIEKALGKRIIIANIDAGSSLQQRKIEERLRANRYKNYAVICTKNNLGIEELKEKIFRSFDKIRIYTKEPGKEKSKKPMILDPDSDIKDVAEKILKGFSQKIKETKIWGPSSKFPGQKVGLKHKLKDLDVVEFKTR